MGDQSNLFQTSYALAFHQELAEHFRQLEYRLERMKFAVVAAQPTDSAWAPLNAINIRHLIRARRARDYYFAADMFADPAWDILLEAYVAGLTQKDISVSGLCHAAAVPATTALRCVTQLEKDGWLDRCNDSKDRRRSWMHLSDRGATAMERYLTAMSRSTPPI